MTIKFTKRSLIAALILFIVAVIYNVIFFVVPFPEVSNTSFYITYGCTLFSLVLALFIFVLAFGGNKDLKTRILGVPIIYVSYSLILAQLLFDIIVMWVGSFVEFKPWIVIIIETLLIGVSLITLIIRVSYRNMIVENDNKDVSKETFIKELRVRIDTIVNENKDELITKELHKLQDLIRCTTPVSNSEVVQIENDIVGLINELRNTNETDKSLSLIEKITNLIKERKMRLQK